MDKKSQIDHRSHKERGLEIDPTLHEGYVARKMEKEGRPSERIGMNRIVKERNQLLLETQRLIEAMREQLQTMIDALKNNGIGSPKNEKRLERRKRRPIISEIRRFI
ncbi:MAG TPA: MobA/MobL family protein [Tissierellia bacterium]|nr:MobA/MobL family protein [Tissierellia bacterium]